MDWFLNDLKTHPELAFFLTLAIGYAVGKIQIRGFKIGSVTGVLVTGLIVGQINVYIDPSVKTIFFLLFLFSLGYNAGPQFFKGLKKDGIPQLMFAIAVCTSGLIATIIAGKILGYNSGQVCGLAAGALTQSSTIGTAQDAIGKMTGVSATQIKSMQDFVPVGFAVTYIFGTLGAVLLLSSLGPKLLGDNLEEESRELELMIPAIGNKKSKEIFEQNTDLDFRAFDINNDVIGCTVSDIEKQIKKENICCFIIRIKRNNKILIPNENTVIEDGDKILFSFNTDSISKLDFNKLGREISDYMLLNIPIEHLKVYVTSDEISNQSIKNIRDNKLTRGVFISSLEKTGEETPYSGETIINKKDVITLTGPLEEVEKLAYKIGKPVRKSNETDVVFLGLGILLGGIIGIPALTIDGIGLSLSTSGGALIMGLIFGFIHSRRPDIGYVPQGAVWFLSNVGLAAFTAVVGIDAGPGFISGLKASGVSFLFAGVFVTTVPIIVGILLGKYVFKFKSPVILGAIAGSMTATAAIGSICEKAKSNTPILGYTITYAVGNILLTVWGSILVVFFR